MEGLKNTLKEQDKKIENLKEKVYILESQVRRELVLYVSVLVHAGVCVCLQVMMYYHVCIRLCMLVCLCDFDCVSV